jgi:BON domain
MNGSARKRLGAVVLGALAGMALGILLADRGLVPRMGRERTDDEDDDLGGDDDEDDIIPPSRAGAAPPRSAASNGFHGSTGSQRSTTRSDAAIARSRSGPVDQEAELEARVLETFRNDPVLMDRPIDIGAIGTGIIELTGWVDAHAEIRHATTLTRGTIGVNTVVNRLLVRGAPAV